jgi:opacity protein-like surface antigen
MEVGRHGAHTRVMRSLPDRIRRPLFLLALLAAAPAALAQYGPPDRHQEFGEPPMGPRQFDITAFGGYQLNGDVGTNGGSLKISDSPAFGGALDVRLHPLGSMELMYEYTKPDARFVSVSPLFRSTGTFGVASHYFQVGGMHVRQMGRLEPFLGLTLGAALYVPDSIPLSGGGSTTANDTWRFAMTFNLGTKIWLTPNVGLRLETRMLMPILFTGGGFYYGTGGSGLATTAGIPSLQFAFTGGLVFGK